MQPKMTDHQKELLSKLTKKRQAVALQRISNPPSVSNAECYRRAGGTARDASVAAHELLSYPDVQEFLATFEQESADNAIMGRDEMLRRLTAMARVDIDDLIDFREIEDEDGNKQTSWNIKNSARIDKDKMGAISEVTAGRDGLKIKVHDQKAAMKQLAELQGFNKPQELKIDANVATRVTLDDFYGTESES